MLMLRRIKRGMHIVTLLVCTTAFTSFAGEKAGEVTDSGVSQPIVELAANWVELVEESQLAFDDVSQQLLELRTDMQDNIAQLYFLDDVDEARN